MSFVKNISILGATGSIGTSALKICDNYSDSIKLISVSAYSDIDNLIKIIDKYKPQFAVVGNGELFRKKFNSDKIIRNGVTIYGGEENIKRITTDKTNDIILNAVSGKAGVKHTVEIIDSGIDVALANKESVVCCGFELFERAKRTGAKIIPVDSEHSAIFILINSFKSGSVRKIHITASGGPFLKKEKSEWETITPQEALNHPTWSMGKKISIDSATMANKGLEVIEAHYLFTKSYDDINVLIHPQSFIHSMIETDDGEIYAQIGPKDMSLPIMNAVFYPEIKNNNFNRFDFSRGINMELIPVDFEKYKMLDYAYYCGRKGGIYPCFYNFVNEALVDKFLNNEIKFLDIERIMGKAINKLDSAPFIVDSVIDNLNRIEDYSFSIFNKII